MQSKASGKGIQQHPPLNTTLFYDDERVGQTISTSFNIVELTFRRVWLPCCTTLNVVEFCELGFPARAGVHVPTKLA